MLGWNTPIPGWGSVLADDSDESGCQPEGGTHALRSQARFAQGGSFAGSG
jgi:hypothetical protein